MWMVCHHILHNCDRTELSLPANTCRELLSKFSDVHDAVNTVNLDKTTALMAAAGGLQAQTASFLVMADVAVVLSHPLHDMH